MSSFIDYLLAELDGCRDRDEAPSLGALELLRLLRMEDGSIRALRERLDAYVDLFRLPPDVGPTEQDEVFRGETFRACVADVVRGSPKADPDLVAAVESTGAAGRSVCSEALAKWFVQLATAGSYRWLRRQWHAGFGGGREGEALREKVVKRLTGAGLKQQCENDAATCWDLEIPDDVFAQCEDVRRKWIEERVHALKQRRLAPNP